MDWTFPCVFIGGEFQPGIGFVKARGVWLKLLNNVMNALEAAILMCQVQQKHN
jgi:hypothetical protein